MKLQVLLRTIHNWGSIIISIPLVIMIGAGILLLLKKDIEWIQPSSQRGASVEVPTVSFQQIFDAAKSVEEAEVTTWAELDRVDMGPDKGIVKVITKNRTEIQIDVHTAEVLSVDYRRSDLIESIHDGTWFADWVKLGIFLPVGIILFVLWLTGIYMFFLPYFKKAQKKKAKAERQAAKS